MDAETRNLLLEASREAPGAFAEAVDVARATGDQTLAKIVFRAANMIHDHLYTEGMVTEARMMYLRLDRVYFEATGHPIMTPEEYGDRYPIEPSPGNAVDPDDKPEPLTD